MPRSKKPKTVAEYIGSYPKNVAARLETIRKIIEKVAPNAEPKISYGMPAYKLNGVLIYFAAHTHHIGLYPFPSTIKAFQKEAKGFKTAKGSIQFPNDKPLPLPLIKKIVEYRIKEKQAKEK